MKMYVQSCLSDLLHLVTILMFVSCTKKRKRNYYFEEFIEVLLLSVNAGTVHGMLNRASHWCI